MELPIRSPIRYEQAADGSWTMHGVPGVEIVSTETPPAPPGPVNDWLAALDLPKEWDQLEALARASAFGDRGFECILVDESSTRFASAWRHRSREILVPHAEHFGLTLAHLGFLVGSVGNVRLCEPGEVEGAEGWCLAASGRLYASALCERVWSGITQGILGDLCVVLIRPPEAEVGAGTLLEVALSAVDEGGCPNPRITKLWIVGKDQQIEMAMALRRVRVNDLAPEVQRQLAQARFAARSRMVSSDR